MVSKNPKPSTSSRFPSWVRLVRCRAMAIARPRRMNSEPNVTMNDGNLVVTTSAPLPNPMSKASTNDTMTASHIDQPKPPASVGVTRIMMDMPVNPTIEPIERSNSPPIINRHTAIAMMPSGAARLRIAAVTSMLTKLLPPATMAKKTQSRTVMMMAPVPGITSSRWIGPTCLTRSSSFGGVSALGASVVTRVLLPRCGSARIGVGPAGWRAPPLDCLSSGALLRQPRSRRPRCQRSRAVVPSG